MKSDKATYRLAFQSDPYGSAKFIEFEGSSSAQAFQVMENEESGRRAELFVGDRRIGTLQRSRSANGLWFLE